MKKKPLALSVAGLTLLSTGLIPDLDGQIAGASSPKKGKVCETANHVLTEVGEQNIHGQWQGKSGPYLHKGGWEVEADFIYWRADEDNLEYAQTVGSKFHRPGNKWDPGFKLGIGYTSKGQDFWDVFFRWTWFHSKQNSSASGTLLPWWQPSLTGATATTASADWTLRYNTLDLEVGRSYFISKTIGLRPTAGLRGAMINQNYKVNYTGTPVGATDFKADTDFWGIGVRVGADFQWHFTKSWAVTSSLAGALLYGSFDVKEHVNLTSTKVDLSRVAPNLEASLGLQWDMFFSKDRCHCTVGLGYEFSEWFSQNQIIRSELFTNAGTTFTHSEHASGDLGLQGMTLKVAFDF